MSPTLDAATIAASLRPDESVGDWNLRAMLLLMQDGDDWSGTDIESGLGAYAKAEALKLVGPFYERQRITTLGCEVAGLLRPTPWRIVDGAVGRQRVKRVVLSVWQGGRCFARPTSRENAERLVALLNADDIRRAKAYKVEP